MSGGGGGEGGTDPQWSTADTLNLQPPQRQVPDAAVAAPGASSSSSYTTSSSTPSGTTSTSEGDSTSTSATSNPQHSYPSTCETFDPRYSPSLAYGPQGQQPYGGQQQQQHHIEATAKHFGPPMPALSTATALQAPFDPPYMSFIQLQQPQPTSHHAQLYHAVESSRYNWDPLTGEPRYAPQDLSYTGLSIGETSPRPRTSGGGPSDRRVSFQLQQPSQDRNPTSLSSAVEVALRSGDGMTIGDLLEMSMSNTAPSLASPGSLVGSSWSGDGPQSPEESDFVPPNQLETAEASNQSTGSAPRVKPFISKLEYLLSHPEYFKDCMVWDDTGTSFIICHAQPRLLSEVLPSFYQHSSLHAFTRQLNVYGFARLSPSELISKLDITSTHDYYGWRHPSFTRDDHSKMHTLTPKPSRARAQKKVEKQEAQVVARQEAEAHRLSTVKQKQQIQQSQQQQGQQRQQEQHLQQRYQQQYQPSAYERPQQAQTFQSHSGSQQQQHQELEPMDEETGSDHSSFLTYSAYTFDAASPTSGAQER